MRGEGNGPSTNARSNFVVVEEIDDVLFEVSALVIVVLRQNSRGLYFQLLPQAASRS